MIFTIHSKDDILGKEKINQILASKNIKADLMNTSEFDCLTTNIDHIIDYCYTTPFFADSKVVILKNPIFLTSDDNKVNFDEFIEKLMHYIENENEATNMFIYLVSEKMDERKKIVKYLREKTTFKQVALLNHLEIKTIVHNRFKKANALIEDNAIDFFLERVGTNLVDIANEVDKLILFKNDQVIKLEDINDFVTCNIDSSIFDLSNAILERNIQKSLSLFDDLITNGMEPIVLINVLSNQFRLALLVKEYKSDGLDNAAIMKKLKKHPYQIKLAGQLKFSNEDIKDNLLKLASLDYKIKIGKINRHHGIKLFILSI